MSESLLPPSPSQLDRVAAWRKGYRDLLELPGLSLLELALLMTIERRGMRDLTRLVAGKVQPDVGWSVRRDERPDTRRELAAILRLAPGPGGLAELDAAIAGLVELGHVVVADDGAVGMARWRATQEDPSAERQRRRRARVDTEDEGGSSQDGDVTPPVTVTPAVTPVPSQRTEDRGQTLEKDEDARESRLTTVVGREIERARLTLGWPEKFAAERVKLPLSTLRAFERGEQLPTHEELTRLLEAYGARDLAWLERELPERDANVARAVVHEHHRLAVVLGRMKPGPPPEPTPDDIRVVWSTGEGAQTEANWLTVLRRVAEAGERDQKRGKESWAVEHFALPVLASPKVRKIYLENADLDRHHDAKQERAPPPLAKPAQGGRGAAVIPYRKDRRGKS